MATRTMPTVRPARAARTRRASVSRASSPRRLASERDGDVEAHIYDPGWETIADVDGETWAPRRRPPSTATLILILIPLNTIETRETVCTVGIVPQVHWEQPDLDWYQFGGIWHEVYFRDASGERKAQGTWNWLYDSAGDLASNFLGYGVGLFVPEGLAKPAGRFAGRVIPGPIDNDPKRTKAKELGRSR